MTLSACETGRSVVTGGDELIGLARGFLYAGAATLVQSLWRVEDGSTARLMDALLRAPAPGRQRQGAALRAGAARACSPRALPPYFWAPFQLVGDAGPLARRRRVATRGRPWRERMSQTGAETTTVRRPQMTRFLPAEVIVLVDAGDAAGALSQRRLRRVYEGTMDWLNESVQGLLQRPPPPSYGSPFEQDMAPVTLRQLCQGAPQVLTPPPVNGGRAPWVHLPDSGKLLCFFGLNTRDGRWPQGTGDEAVRELVNLINRRLLGRPFPERGAPPRPSRGGSLAATPHWLAAGAQSDLHRRRPGGPPRPRRRRARGASTSTTTASTASPRAPARATWWSPSWTPAPPWPRCAGPPGATRTTGSCRSSPGPGERFTIDEDLSVPGRLLRHLDALRPLLAGRRAGQRRRRRTASAGRARPAHLPSERYLMPDHGLFSASIVRQLAPTPRCTSSASSATTAWATSWP